MSRILIVEDEEHLAAGLKLNLEAEGFVAEVEEDGQAALNRLTAESSVFDVVLLDVMLPGLDGFEVVRRLREARQFVPVMLLTARAHNDDVLRGFEAGADDYLSKPFDLSILLARLTGLLRRRTWLRGNGPAEPGEEFDEFCFAGKRIDFREQVLHWGRDRATTDANGGNATEVPRSTRGGYGVPQGAARRSVGSAGGHGYAHRRQLCRSIAPAISRRRPRTRAIC